MTDAPSLAAASVSLPLWVETPRHLYLRRDGPETTSETVDLKALARVVLARDTRRDSNRDRTSPGTETPAETAPAFDRKEASSEQVVTSVPTASPPRKRDTETVRTWGTAEEERAAIVEYAGNTPRAWAEGFALLNPHRPPGDVPLRRWQTFVDDVGRFLDCPFRAVAIALGWGPHDLFGCDRDRPFARLDKAGLLWLLDGDRLVALCENTATIETRSGRRQTFRRKPVGSGRVLAWELAQ
jgi:hypothetical protein